MRAQIENKRQQKNGQDSHVNIELIVNVRVIEVGELEDVDERGAGYWSELQILYQDDDIDEIFLNGVEQLEIDDYASRRVSHIGLVLENSE